MSQRGSLLRACIFGAALSFTAGFAGHALASDPLPGDDVTIPVNINIGMFYQEFNGAGSFGHPHGSDTTSNTRIANSITVFRYIRSFSVGGYVSGVQAYVPIVAFLGNQSLGLPSTGPFGAKGYLSSNSGFAQPNFSAFFWPYSDPKSGTYLVTSVWVSPPISSFDKSKNLTPSPNVWLGNLEIGARTTLIGTPTTQNLSVELWSTTYVYSNNGSSAYNTPALSLNGLPYPVIPATSTAATFREQPSEELRFYAPYEFLPETRGFIAPGFYQSFGGKQTYKLGNGYVLDSGNRTQESQLRLVVASFVSPTLQVMGIGGYDVASKGGPLNRYFEIRLAKFF